jgi:glycosyltransferase involved in cell wall biosynthesis
MTRDGQLHILVSAYACEPHRGSEPGIGWGVATALAQHHRVWVVTADLHRAAIEEELANNPRPHLRVAYYRLPRILEWFARTIGGHSFRYYVWQFGAARLVLKLRREVRFDVIQHVSYVRYWQPNVLALLPVPFVFGPVGGAESTPAPFRATYSVRGRIKDACRDLVRVLGEYDPLVRLTIRFSAMTLATTPATALRLHALGSNEIALLTCAALAEDEVESLARSSKAPGRESRFISIGRLLDWKGFHLGVSAFARADPAGAEYWIVGAGPERSALERQARDLGVHERVRFFGELPRAEALRLLTAADVLVHPSLHDSGGWVCLEAMAACKPVLCLDHGGPGQIVTSQTGVKVPANAPEQAIGDLARAMKRLAADPELRRSMGQEGHKRVKEHYSWERKIEHHLDCFAKVCSSRAGQTISQPAVPGGRSEHDRDGAASQFGSTMGATRGASDEPREVDDWETFFPPSTRVLALPSWVRPRVLVPATTLAGRMFGSKSYAPSRCSAQILLFRLKAVLGLGARYSGGGTSPLLQEFLADAYPEGRVGAVHVGSNGPARKWTLQLADNSGRIVAYVKCAAYPLARERLAHEFRLLSRLPAGVAPIPVKYGSLAGYDALVLTVVHGKRLRPTIELSAQLHAFTRLLLGADQYSVESHPWVQARGYRSGEVTRLLEELVHRQWPVAIQHGDLVPWNLIAGEDGRLTAVDWEYGFAAGFPVVDLAQYVLQVARLIYRWSPARARESAIRQLLQDEHLNLTRREAAALVGIAAYEAHQQTTMEAHIPADWAQLWRRAIWEAAI